MLGDLPRHARHIRGFPRKDIFVIMEEVDKRAFLFGGKHGANEHHFALRATVIYEDLLGTLYRLERPDRLLGVGCFFSDLLPDGRKLFGGDNCRGMFATLDLALIGALEEGDNSDDPAWS